MGGNQLRLEGDIRVYRVDRVDKVDRERRINSDVVWKCHSKA